jgi:peptidyl-prolyl cis-trans isomerase A (cyclophilin A)
MRRQLALLSMVAALTVLPQLTARTAFPRAARTPGVYAVFETSMGTIVCELFEKQTPVTVANFVGLAQGTKEWMTPKGQFVKQPYYDGVVFHRVLKGTLIQAGDVTKAGNFTPIPPFQDEIVAGLTFDRAGMLAMANNGPGTNTNRTQFFITVKPSPYLNRKHTIFGRVVEGLEVATKISEVPLFGSRPRDEVVIKKVTIQRVDKPSQ